MSLGALPHPHTGDRDTDRAIKALVDRVNDLLRRDPSIDGVTLQAVRISDTGLTAVPHLLGRSYRGWRVERIYQQASLTTPGIILEASTERRDTHIELRMVGADAPLFVDLRAW